MRTLDVNVPFLLKSDDASNRRPYFYGIFRPTTLVRSQVVSCTALHKWRRLRTNMSVPDVHATTGLPVRVKIGPLVARIVRNYVINRPKAEVGPEGLRAENDQPLEFRRSTSPMSEGCPRRLETRSLDKVKIDGAQPPLRPKHIWSIRTMVRSKAGRAIGAVNVAIDSKLRGCDLVVLKVDKFAPGGYAADWATVRPKENRQTSQI